MNPLTQVKNVQKITAREAAAGVSDDASWHAKYKESAYIFVGGLSYDLTEGDLLAVFSQYGEIVDVNLVRDKATGKSKGFAFLAYQDQRSTILAVDNLNGATIVGRTVRVDHVSNYKRKQEEDEEEEQKKREERGVCYAFQKGECQRGAACRFSHDEERNANTGWGGKDSNTRWEHDRYEVGSQRQHHKKPKYDIRSREDGRDGDNRSRLAGKSDQRSEYSQDIHVAAVHEEANTKDVGRWSKHDERRDNWNKLKEEKVGFARPIDAGNHYMDTAPGRKRDYDEKGFASKSIDAGKSGQRSKSKERQDRHVATRHEEAKTKDDAGKSGQRSRSKDRRRQDRHVATRHEEAKTKDDDRLSKYDEKRTGQNRRDEKQGFTRPKEAENRSMDTMSNRARTHDERGFDSRPTYAHDKDGDKRSRDCSRRDYDKSKKDGDKRSRDHGTREHDRNVRDNDRKETNYYCR